MALSLQVHLAVCNMGELTLPGHCSNVSNASTGQKSSACKPTGAEELRVPHVYSPPRTPTRLERPLPHENRSPKKKEIETKT